MSRRQHDPGARVCGAAAWVYSAVPVCRLLTVGALVVLGGCVNNYIVDDDGGTSGAALGSGTSTAGSDSGEPSTGGTDSSDGGSGGGSADGDSSGSSGLGLGTTDTGSDGGATGGLESCQPCTASRQCGDAFDLCVMLGESSQCMNNCGEGPTGCPVGFSCQEQTSIDALMGSLCLPDSGACGS